MAGPGALLFVFDTTTAALWGEEVAEAAGIPVEVVPAPPGSGALCDLALRTTGALEGRLAEALRKGGVSFRTWRSGTHVER